MAIHPEAAALADLPVPLCEMCPGQVCRFHEASLDLAKGIADGPPLALGITKTLLRQGASMDVDSFLEAEARAQAIALTSAESIERRSALLSRISAKKG